MELKPVYLLTDCDPSKTINKVSAVFQNGKTDEDQKPVAFVGFSCDAEQKVFGDLASLWNVPIISTGHDLIVYCVQCYFDIGDENCRSPKLLISSFTGTRRDLNSTRGQLDTTARVGINAEIVADFLIGTLVDKHNELYDLS